MALEALSAMYWVLIPAPRYGGQMRMQRCNNFGPMFIDAYVGILNLGSLKSVLLRECWGVHRQHALVGSVM